MPDDHSKVVPLLPIPNRTVKRLSADDSADSRVKVGHRQASTASKPPVIQMTGGFVFAQSKINIHPPGLVPLPSGGGGEGARTAPEIAL